MSNREIHLGFNAWNDLLLPIPAGVLMASGTAELHLYTSNTSANPLVQAHTSLDHYNRLAIFRFVSAATFFGAGYYRFVFKESGATYPYLIDHGNVIWS